MIKKEKVEAIKNLYEKSKSETIEIEGETFHGWSINGINKHLHLNILNDIEIVKLYELEDEKKSVNLKEIEYNILLNRIDKFFINTLQIEIYRLKRFNLPLSLIYIELTSDLAKKDLELKMIKYIKKIIRPTDFLTSINYNKYLLLCTHTDKEQAKKIMDRIIDSIEILIDIYKIEIKFSIIEFSNEKTPQEFIKKALNI